MASIQSNKSILRRPSKKLKPPNLRGTLLDSSEEDYLVENLLGDADSISSHTRESPDSAQRRRILDSPVQLPYRLVIAVDYGTTFTGVAFAAPKLDDYGRTKIFIVDNWGPAGTNRDKIPSVISYSPASKGERQWRERQWGDNLSPDSVAMVNTKLELDVQDSKLDELELILLALDGMGNLGFDNVKASKGHPEYTWKSPEEIVTDYLTEVFQYLSEVMDYFGHHLKDQIPVDIVITVPVKWSYRAKNSTLRAVKKAGFNEESFPNLQDIIMVSEPEAAAIYTARYLKENAKKELLRPGECFVLCDAGGGTVDVVSYKVTQLEPILELEEMTISTSAKCGSSYIDVNFKRWLRRHLGERNYLALDPRSKGRKITTNATEGKEMRVVMKIFDEAKRKFPKHNKKMDLPKPLDNLNVPGKVFGGEIGISYEDMRSFFDPCVDQVIELIQGQILQVEKTKNRVRNVFLVGGFGESPYLQRELNHSIGLRGITMQLPDTSWTAVVRGAVMYGIEKASHNNVTFTTTCPTNYGIVLDEIYVEHKYDGRERYTDPLTNNIMAHKQLTWLIRKGDLLLSDAKSETEKDFIFPFQKIDDLKFKLPIYEYPDDDLPDRFETAQTELMEVAVLNCDLSTKPITDFDQSENPKTKQPYYTAYLICKVILSVSYPKGLMEIDDWN
ncbi:MAG: hypothetical protein M1813_005932 [Trichoglossum hirsutum]|nr:MAG: hypothetical protein M1813_005932 [Trichoglossum hirsutum]